MLVPARLNDCMMAPVGRNSTGAALKEDMVKARWWGLGELVNKGFL